MHTDFDLAILSRLQFAFTIGFHILWPTITIGLGPFLLLLEGLWLKTQNSFYKDLYQFWVKIFALAFGMGVVTGIPLSYQFGTNFSGLSELAGAVLGPLLSVEVMTAFFLEAAFVGVMIFGWKKVPPILHFLATLLVVIGTHNSAFWIIAANSWMQTPQGAHMTNGLMVVDSWREVIFNPSFPYRLLHSLMASYLSAAMLVLGISGWLLIQKKQKEINIKGFRLALLFACLFAPLQILMGDLHGIQVKNTQPAKLAAMEALWATRNDVPLILFTLPNEQEERNGRSLEIPHLASLILNHNIQEPVKGLKEWPKEERPPITLVFCTFRIMVGIGFYFLFLCLWGLLIIWRHGIFSRSYLWLCVLSAPLGFIATLCGWITAEVGRQPYVIYGILKTKDALSPVIPELVASSLFGFIVVYAIMFAFFLFYCHHLITKGPAVSFGSPSGNKEDAEWLHIATHTTHLTHNRKGEM